MEETTSDENENRINICSSQINENRINISPSSEILTCMDCPYIPSIKLNANQHSINVECQNKIKISSEGDDMSGHFHNKILLKDYLRKIRKNYQNQQKECSLCNKKIDIEEIYFCSSCNIFMCKKCLNDKHMKEKNDHPSIKFDSINTCCYIHKKENKFYCKNCFENICENCLNSNFHKNHEIIKLNDILIDDKYLKEINDEINNEEKTVKTMSNKFERYMDFIQEKFDEYIHLRNEEVQLKKNILNTYEKNKNNYNAINNVRKIKFNYYKINEDKEMEQAENKNLNQLKSFKRLINELILYEETKYKQKNKQQEIEPKLDDNNENIDNMNPINRKPSKEKDKIKCYKENILLKSSKYEVMNKINLQNVDVEKVLSLKNNKLLIAFKNRMVSIYEKNDLKNSLQLLCSVRLSNTKINASHIHVINFKGIYQLKNEDLLISMSGLSNFILRVNYETKTFRVVQEFMISRGLKINNPLFMNLPNDPNNYNDIIPTIGNVPNLNNINFNNNINDKSDKNIINDEIKNSKDNNINDNSVKKEEQDNSNKINIEDNKDNKDNNANNNTIQGDINNNRNPINNTFNRIHNALHFIPFPQRQIMNRFLGRRIPVHQFPIPARVNRINNVIQRRRTLLSLVALQNDDLLAISNKDCWILRKNAIKYVAYLDQLIQCDKILMVRKAVPFSENEFLVEVRLMENRQLVPINKQKYIKYNLLYIFFNLNYEETARVNLNLGDTEINSDNDFIYINDKNSLLMMDIKLKEVINIIEVNSLGPIITIKNNKSFFIQEKENNAIVEYRIINNEVVRCKKIIENKTIKLISGLDDIFNTLIIQYKNESLLFLQ